MGANKLSLTLHVRPRAIYNLFRGGKGICRSGGVPDGGVLDGLPGTSGDRIWGSGDSIWGSGDDNRESGDGGRVDVDDALVARDADRSRNGEDSHGSGTGVRRRAPSARECTYQDFMKCKPLYFKDTKGVVELTGWFERMETVFCISNCTVKNQIKFAICTLLESALTWWNYHVKTVGPDVAYAMTWTNLKK
uniref:Reverse transcriptase domain-containing protein n=1 Tax=Tanacetum cinerariifolium TaxID=118510 RepID=A0A6L2L8Z3_TANCI|nr:hypothetical protein [Tanacetum cinerariifolium]